MACAWNILSHKVSSWLSPGYRSLPHTQHCKYCWLYKMSQRCAASFFQLVQFSCLLILSAWLSCLMCFSHPWFAKVTCLIQQMLKLLFYATTLQLFICFVVVYFGCLEMWKSRTWHCTWFKTLNRQVTVWTLNFGVFVICRGINEFSAEIIVWSSMGMETMHFSYSF